MRTHGLDRQLSNGRLITVQTVRISFRFTYIQPYLLNVSSFMPRLTARAVKNLQWALALGSKCRLVYLQRLQRAYLCLLCVYSYVKSAQALAHSSLPFCIEFKCSWTAWARVRMASMVSLCLFSSHKVWRLFSSLSKDGIGPVGYSFLTQWSI